MLNLRRTAYAFLSVIAVAGIIGSGAWAASNEPKIGIVDTQRVYKDAPRMKQYQEELTAFEQSLAAKLDIRAQNMMLNESEIKELIDLKTKDKPTDADNARIKALTDTERAKDDELKKLQESKDLNDQQKARLKELQDLESKSKSTGNALVNDYKTQAQSKGAELQAKADTEIQAAVAKVAEAKGLSLVLDKVTVMLGGVDVTDDVIARLDRKMQ